MTPGKSLLNFYWMEGPLPGDQGCRVTVLHPGQDRQCGYCLQTKMEGCPGQGQAKVCKELGTNMTRMIDYMSKVKELTGYESLKTTYARKFPSLSSKNTLSSNMTENSNDDDEENQDNPPQSDNQANFLSGDVSKYQTLIDDLRKQLTEKEGEVRILSEKVNPSESLIDDLRKQLTKKEDEVSNLSESLAKNPDIQKMENLEKDVSEKNQMINEQQQQHVQLKLFCDLSTNKLSTAKMALVNFLCDNISNPDFNEFHPSFKFIIAQFSSILSSPDDYSSNPDNKEVTLHTQIFEERPNCDPVTSKNLEFFRKQLKHKLELDCAVRLERRNSVGRGRKSSIPGLSKKRHLDANSPDANAKRSPSNHSRN